MSEAEKTQQPEEAEKQQEETNATEVEKENTNDNKNDDNNTATSETEKTVKTEEEEAQKEPATTTTTKEQQEKSEEKKSSKREISSSEKETQEKEGSLSPEEKEEQKALRDKQETEDLLQQQIRIAKMSQLIDTMNESNSAERDRQHLLRNVKLGGEIDRSHSIQGEKLDYQTPWQIEAARKKKHVDPVHEHMIKAAHESPSHNYYNTASPSSSSQPRKRRIIMSPSMNDDDDNNSNSNTSGNNVGATNQQQNSPPPSYFNNTTTTNINENNNDSPSRSLLLSSAATAPSTSSTNRGSEPRYQNNTNNNNQIVTDISAIPSSSSPYSAYRNNGDIKEQHQHQQEHQEQEQEQEQEQQYLDIGDDHMDPLNSSPAREAIEMLRKDAMSDGGIMLPYNKMRLRSLARRSSPVLSRIPPFRQQEAQAQAAQVKEHLKHQQELMKEIHKSAIVDVATAALKRKEHDTKYAMKEMKKKRTGEKHKSMTEELAERAYRRRFNIPFDEVVLPNTKSIVVDQGIPSRPVSDLREAAAAGATNLPSAEANSFYQSSSPNASSLNNNSPMMVGETRRRTTPRRATTPRKTTNNQQQEQQQQQMMRRNDFAEDIYNNNNDDTDMQDSRTSSQDADDFQQENNGERRPFRVTTPKRKLGSPAFESPPPPKTTKGAVQQKILDKHSVQLQQAREQDAKSMRNPHRLISYGRNSPTNNPNNNQNNNSSAAHHQQQQQQQQQYENVGLGGCDTPPAMDQAMFGLDIVAQRYASVAKMIRVCTHVLRGFVQPSLTASEQLGQVPDQRRLAEHSVLQCIEAAAASIDTVVRDPACDIDQLHSVESRLTEALATHNALSGSSRDTSETTAESSSRQGSAFS